MSLLDNIFQSGKVSDYNGQEFPLHSHTSREQCYFLHTLIETLRKPEISLEIGLAYGISALQILESMGKRNPTFRHLVIDPFQKTQWNDIGIANMQRSGFSARVTIYEDLSHQVLPELLHQKVQLDFAYVDSTKVFDTLMVDLYYLIRMLKVGGIVVLDDCNYPGVRLLSRFLAVHPSLKLIGAFNRDSTSLKGEVVNSAIELFVKLLPRRIKDRWHINLATDKQLGVNYKCLAFLKTADDSRSWDWFKPF